MSLDAELRSRGLRVVTDSRAKHRKGFTPVGLEVVHIDEADTTAALSAAVDTTDCPLVLVTSIGNVFVLAEGGTGRVAVQGAEGALSQEATDALAVVLEVLSEVLGIGAAPKPKAKRKKTAIIESADDEGTTWLVVEADDNEVVTEDDHTDE